MIIPIKAPHYSIVAVCDIITYYVCIGTLGFNSSYCLCLKLYLCTKVKLTKAFSQLSWPLSVEWCGMYGASDHMTKGCYPMEELVMALPLLRSGCSTQMFGVFVFGITSFRQTRCNKFCVIQLRKSKTVCRNLS